jgi:hypothetical protein
MKGSLLRSIDMSVCAPANQATPLAPQCVLKRLNRGGGRSYEHNQTLDEIAGTPHRRLSKPSTICLVRAFAQQARFEASADSLDCIVETLTCAIEGDKSVAPYRR